MKRILICGAGGSPSTNFVRSLRTTKEKMILVGIDCDKYTLQRAETDIRILVPSAGSPEYLNIVNQIINEYKIEFMYSQNDKEIGYISRNRKKIKTKLFLPSKKTVEICQNKFRSFEAWKKAGIKIPETLLIRDKKDLKKAFRNFGREIWLRNIKGAAGAGSYPAKDYHQAVSWIDFQKGWGSFTAAERLSENSVTWQSIWYKGNLIVAQGRKRLYWEFANRAPSGITGITGTGVTYSDPVLDTLAIAAIKAIDKKPHGIFSVDMTYDENNIPNPTEINIGRFFTTHFFFSKAGLNMPEIFVKLAYNEKFPQHFPIMNPLKNGLVWIRGMDFEPILTDMSIVEKSVKNLEKRLNNLKE